MLSEGYVERILVIVPVSVIVVDKCYGDFQIAKRHCAQINNPFEQGPYSRYF